MVGWLAMPSLVDEVAVVVPETGMWLDAVAFCTVAQLCMHSLRHGMLLVLLLLEYAVVLAVNHGCQC